MTILHFSLVFYEEKVVEPPENVGQIFRHRHLPRPVGHSLQRRAPTRSTTSTADSTTTIRVARTMKPDGRASSGAASTRVKASTTARVPAAKRTPVGDRATVRESVTKTSNPM